MKKRLISLLVALCMAVTLLPVSALTAWAEESSQLKIVGGYPVGSGENHDRNCSGDGWSYDGSTQTLTLDPSTPTTYDLKESGNIRQDQNSILCSAIIEKNATIVNGNFLDIDNPGPSITNDGTITSGSYSMHVINHGTITGGTFFDPITNDPTGTIENGTFLSTVTNNGTIKGGIFRKKPTGGTVHKGYTLNVNQNNGSYEIRYATINGLGSSGYVIPNSDHDTSVTIKYTFFRSSSNRVFSNDVTFEDTNDTPCLLEDWAPSARYYDNGSGYFSVTFTAPPATAATVTLSMLTRLVIDKDGYPVGTKGGTQDYSGNGWKFENDTLTLEPAAKTNYDFNSTDLNPHRVAVNCPVTVNSNATITNGIFLKEVTGSALNGVFLNVPTGCENSAKKITVSDNGTITALKTSGDTTTLESAAKELYVVGQPTGTLYVTLSSGKVREVQLPLTADLELLLNDPKPKPEPEPEPKPEPKPEPEPETYTLKVVGGSFTTGERDALTSGTVPVDAEANVALNPDAVPEGMVFDQWAISEESLLGNPNVAYNAESFTIPANAVEKGKTVTVEAQYREATIESEGPGILGTGALIATGVVGSAALLYQGHMLGTELYLRYLLPHGAVIPQNRAELAVLLWQDAENPEPVSTTLYSDISEDDSAIQQAARWAVENNLMEQLDADDHPDHFDPFVPVTFSDSIRAWKKAQELKK